jgi:tetratricopeptide (TPR) repeat protein
LEKLYTETQAENIPAVFLIVARRFEVPSFSRPAPGERAAFISQMLSRDESRKFADTYKKAAPERSGLLETLQNRNLRERTPFIFALTTFEERFLGIPSFVHSRLAVATETQRNILTYLALVYFFAHKPLNVNIFAVQLNQLKSQSLRLEKQLREPQLELLIREEGQKWRPTHQLIAEEILTSVLAGTGDRRLWWSGLSTLATDFIKLCHDGSYTYDDDLIETLRRMFIQRDEQELLGAERIDIDSPKFARLIEEVRNSDGQQLIFEQLVDSFPQEPHFWGHLGRFHSIQKRPQKALEAIGKALDLSPRDPVLHHMRGMCYCRAAFEDMSELRLKQKRGGKITDEEKVALQQTVEHAKESFNDSLSLDPASEYAYISQIQLLLRILDFGYAISGLQKRTDFLTSPAASWYLDQLDEAGRLMDQAETLREGEKPNQSIKKYQEELDRIDNDQSRALERWNNLLAQTRIFAPPIRRQIVRAYLARRNHDWSSLSPDEIERIVTLMEQNIREEPKSDYNIRYWFRAIRYSRHQNITVALDRVTNWKTIGDSLEANYYLYVLYVLEALDGDTIRLVKAEDLINQSTEKSRNQAKRTRSFEWLGEGIGLRRLKHYSELGEWDEEADFYSNTTGLAWVEGVVKKYRSPRAGTIEITLCGLPVFFVPAKAGIERGKHANVRVRFYLGFSYSGLRAWNVEQIQ